MTEAYTAKFSHEFEDGPSGPARSYWDISAAGKRLGCVCLHPRDPQANPQLTIDAILNLLDQAHQRGRAEKSAEIRAALDLTS